jgi:hypothetical protein
MLQEVQSGQNSAHRQKDTECNSSIMFESLSTKMKIEAVTIRLKWDSSTLGCKVEMDMQDSYRVLILVHIVPKLEP